MTNQSKNTESDSLYALLPGPIQWAVNMAVYIVVGGLAYILSMALLFAFRDEIIAASSEGTFTMIFGVWVLGTLYLIGKFGGG